MVILFGILIAGFGVLGIIRSVRLRTKGIFAVGTVTNIRMQGKLPILIVSFKTLREKTVIFRAGGWTAINLTYQVGMPVPVLYNRENPSEAVVYSVDFMWYLPLVFVACGLFLVYQGFMHP